MSANNKEQTKWRSLVEKHKWAKKIDRAWKVIQNSVKNSKHSVKKFEEKHDDTVILIGAISFIVLSLVLSLTVIAGVAFLINIPVNNRVINKPSHYTVSYAKGINGHIEFTRYRDTSAEIKNYPGLGHHLFDSKLYIDLNGDDKIDRIRENGAKWKFNRLNRLLVRELDREKHKDLFDAADNFLARLKKKYPLPNNAKIKQIREQTP